MIDCDYGEMIIDEQIKNKKIKSYLTYGPENKISSDFFAKVLCLSTTEDILHKISAHITGAYVFTPTEILQMSMELSRRHENQKSD